MKSACRAQKWLTKRSFLVLLLTFIWSINGSHAVGFKRDYTEPYVSGTDDSYESPEDDLPVDSGSMREHEEEDEAFNDPESFLEEDDDEDEEEYNRLFVYPQDHGRDESLLEMQEDEPEVLEKNGEIKKYMNKLGAAIKAKKAFKNGKERLLKMKRAAPEHYRRIKRKLSSGNYGKNVGKFVKDGTNSLRRRIRPIYNKVKRMNGTTQEELATEA